MTDSNALEQLQHRLRTERMVAEIAQVLLRETHYEKAFHLACEIMGEATGVSRVYIFENFDNNSRCTNTVEWVAPGIDPVKDDLRDVPYESIRYWSLTLERGEYIRAEDIRSLPEEVVEILSWQDIQSILVVPLRVFDEFAGFLGFDVCGQKRAWKDDDVAMLETVSHLISSVMEKRELEQQLAHSGRLSAVGSLAAGIAHEYNNLHAGIMGLIELALEDSELTDRTRRDLKRVLALVERGVELTRRLLGISRQESKEELVDLRSVVTDTVALTTKSMKAGGVNVSFSCSSKSPWVMGSRTDLGQVLLNLLLNAVEAMQGCTERHIDIMLRDGPSQRVQLDVLDTGPGVPEPLLGRIFEPFFTTKGKLGGGNRESTGLGLSISSRVAAQHGGSLTARNRAAGKGAHFRLELPQTPIEPDDDLTDWTQQDPTPPPVELGRIGVLDDEPPIVDVLTRYFSRVGHYVEGFDSPEMARQACLRRRFDILFVDVIMPEEGGRRFLEWVMAQPDDQRPEIIIMSGKEKDAVSEDLGGLPIERFVPKPFPRLQTINDLVQRVLRDVVARRRATPEPE
jgi:signal transduction histidine kinase